MDIFTRVFHRITNTHKLVDGNEVLIIYYVVIVIMFLIDHYLRGRIRRDSGREEQRLIKIYAFYEDHTYVLVNLILYFICLFLLIKDTGFDLDYLLTLTLDFIVFTIVLEIFLKLFIDEESYRSRNLLSYLNVIYYVIISNYFTHFSPFVSRPGLFITFSGLCIGVIACFYIMVKAILNPKILRRNVDVKEDVVSYGILRGMLGIVICIALIEYLMVYSCFKTNIDLYGTGEGRVLNAWDMLYFFVVSFTTIGYGDIYPQRIGLLYYSEFASIVIGISSLFTTACFVAAVISTASSLANSGRFKKKRNQTTKVSEKRNIKTKRAILSQPPVEHKRK